MDAGDVVDDEDLVCDDDNDQCRFGQMQITVNLCMRPTNKSLVTLSGHISTLLFMIACTRFLSM